MAAIIVDQVKRIIETEVSDDDITNGYIPTVDALMSSVFAAGDLTDALDTQIRIYLTAHFISATRDPEAGSLLEARSDQMYTRVAGGVGTKDMFGAGLKLSRYGQMAILLDPTGNLADISNPDLGDASIEVVEPPYPDPIYPERVV